MSSYLVLARKWRPRSFQEVIGQEYTLRALSNALTQQRLHHAYLFTGTRGVGKTTIARILAKCLNCETGITATPCNQCDACQEIDHGCFIDMIEVDAASRTKVEDTRDLLDNVQYLPAKARYKVYLIDEVHMLSGHSFNALLKTLEEPPKHVIFIFATTDPQRMPATVLSRCLQFNLKTISADLIQQQLLTILKAEEIPYEIPALKQLAYAANGSIRDALSLLDQAIAYGNNQILTTDINTLLGAVDHTHILKLLTAIAAQDASSLLATITNLADLGVNFINVLDALLEVLQQIALWQLVKTPTPALSEIESQAEVTLSQQLADQFNPEEVQLYYQIGLMGKRDLPLAPNLQSGFVMTMLRMLAFAPVDTTTNAIPTCSPATSAAPKLSPPGLTAPCQSSPDLTATSVSSPDLTATSVSSRAPRSSCKVPPAESPTITPPPPTPTAASSNNTTEIFNSLEITGPTKALLQHLTVATIVANHIELLLDPSQAALLNKKHEERLAASFSSLYKKPMSVKINVGTPNMNTKANLLNQELAQKKSIATLAIANDPKINEIIAKFNATIIPNSIKSEE